jgi:succinate dehydrogenase / fumarate reductase membrane anchor subunit
MTSTPTDFRGRLKRVKGLGAAHHGVSHWWLQRVTAVAMIPLSVWFVWSLVTVLSAPNVVKVAEWFSSSVNAVLMVALLGAAFAHAKLGLQVVIEDYVKGHGAKFCLLLANVFICYLFAAVSILAVLKLHFLDIAATV